MDDRWLKRICRKWQRRLGLMDWTIGASFSPVAELVEGTCANVTWNPDDMTSAALWVALPDDVEHEDKAWYLESCIVHELIHLLFYGHLPVPEYNVNEERAINKTALALLPKRKRK
jgi:hypothetical protein